MTPPLPPTPPKNSFATPPSPIACPQSSGAARDRITHRRAFTLLEVMMAMAIFAVAFVSLAVLFPTAMTIQRQTLHEIQGGALEKNVTAMLKTRKFTINATPGDQDLDDTSIVANDTNVNAIDLASIDAKWKWTLSDRAFPASMPHYDDASKTSERRYVWVPLAQRTSIGGAGPITAATNWKIWVFVLKRELTDTQAYHQQTSSSWAIPMSNDDRRFPGVYKLSLPSAWTPPGTANPKFTVTNKLQINGQDVQCLNAGDMFLDNNGNIHWVKAANLTSITIDGNPDPSKDISYIWCSPRPNANLSSPTVNILVLTDVVQ